MGNSGKTRHWARHQARTGALGHRRACWGAGPCSGRWAVRQSAGRAGARGRQVRGAGRHAGRPGPGRLGWPWAVHSVHSAHFRSVLTRFFS